jgi:uncharacterized protein (UPF0332 family)
MERVDFLISALNSMSFAWRDFLTFAETIKPAESNIGPREAALRSAVSRAYYSAFRTALDFGQRLGYIPTRAGDDHVKIRQYFRESKPADVRKKKISVELERLYNYRRQADYENPLRSSAENMAVYAINMAHSVLRNIDELSQ